MSAKQNNKIDPTTTFTVSELINGLQWFKNKYGDFPVVFMEKGKFGTSVALVRSMNNIARVMRLANSGGGVSICALRYKDPDSEYDKYSGAVVHTEKGYGASSKECTGGNDMTNTQPKEERFDCMITAGQIDHKYYGHFVKNDLRVCEVAKHNVTLQEARDWLNSLERWKRTSELEEFGRNKFGKDYWMEWRVCHFFTLASEDKKELSKEETNEHDTSNHSNS